MALAFGIGAFAPRHAMPGTDHTYRPQATREIVLGRLHARRRVRPVGVLAWLRHGLAAITAVVCLLGWAPTGEGEAGDLAAETIGVTASVGRLADPQSDPPDSPGVGDFAPQPLVKLPPRRLAIPVQHRTSLQQRRVEPGTPRGPPCWLA